MSLFMDWIIGWFITCALKSFYAGHITICVEVHSYNFTHESTLGSLSDYCNHDLNVAECDDRQLI